MTEASPTPGLSLDSGALIALERGDARVRALLRKARSRSLPIHVVPEVVAQVWRGGPRQGVIARFLKDKHLIFPVMDQPRARAVGEICGRSGHYDVIDAYVVLDAALHGLHVVTSDADDLRKVDPTLPIIRV